MKKMFPTELPWILKHTSMFQEKSGEEATIERTLLARSCKGYISIAFKISKMLNTGSSGQFSSFMIRICNHKTNNITFSVIINMLKYDYHNNCIQHHQYNNNVS